MVSLVPVPKTSLSAPEVGTVFLPATKTLCSAEFSSSIALTRGMLYTSSRKCCLPCFLAKKNPSH